LEVETLDIPVLGDLGWFDDVGRMMVVAALGSMSWGRNVGTEFETIRQ